MRKPHGFRGEVQLRRNDGRTSDAALRHGTDRPERQPVDPSHGERSWSVHRSVPGSIAGSSECAWLPLHPSQRDRDGRASGIRWHCRCEPSTSHRCDSRAAAVPTDGGRLGSVRFVRVLNGYGSCPAPPPSLQGSSVGPVLHPDPPEIDDAPRCRNGRTMCELSPLSLADMPAGISDFCFRCLAPHKSACPTCGEEAGSEILMTEPMAISFARRFVKVGCCCRVAAKSWETKHE